MKRHNFRKKTLMSFIFSFLLTLLFLVFYICSGFCIGVFNDRSIVISINESGYYNKVYENISRNSEAILQKAGFPAVVVKDIITYDNVYENSKNYVSHSLEGKKYQVDTSILHSKLSDSIKQYLKQQKIAETDEVNLSIEKLANRIENEYKSNTELQFVNYYIGYKASFQKLVTVILPAVIILISILCFFLIRMHRHRHRGLRYITYALMASSGMTLSGAVYLIISKWYERIDTAPAYYRDFIISCLRWDTMAFVYLGGIGLILSVILISLTGYLKDRIS